MRVVHTLSLALLLGFLVGVSLRGVLGRWWVRLLLALGFLPLFDHVLTFRAYLGAPVTQGGWRDPTFGVMHSDVVLEVTGISLVLVTLVALSGMLTVGRYPKLAALYPMLLLVSYALLPFSALTARLGERGLLRLEPPDGWTFWLTLLASAGLFGYTLGQTEGQEGEGFDG